jgi:hypothetical protein
MASEACSAYRLDYSQLGTLGQFAGCQDTFTKISRSVKPTSLCEFCKPCILLIPFDTPIISPFSKPTEMSGFTSHPLCLEARHAILAETLALAEDLSTLREVRSFRHLGSIDCPFITFWMIGTHERRQGSPLGATETAPPARWE